MNIEEVKKNLIPHTLSQVKEREFIAGRWHFLNPYEIIDKLLNLTYPNGEKVLAIVAETQRETIKCPNPDCGYHARNIPADTIADIDRCVNCAFQDKRTPDKDGYVWRRTKV